VAAIVNSLWDLRGRLEGKPVWKILVDLSPEEQIKLIDFTYIEDCVTKEEALALLSKDRGLREERTKTVVEEGLPAYTTAAGWLGYSEEKIVRLANQFMDGGFTAFKLKVGSNLEDDKRRLAIMRRTIGWERKLMVDANQKWGRQQAIDWMKQVDGGSNILSLSSSSSTGLRSQPTLMMCWPTRPSLRPSGKMGWEWLLVSAARTG